MFKYRVICLYLYLWNSEYRNYANFAKRYGDAVTTYHKVKTTFMPHELATVMLYGRFFWRKIVWNPCYVPALCRDGLGVRTTSRNGSRDQWGSLHLRPCFFLRRPILLGTVRAKNSSILWNASLVSPAVPVCFLGIRSPPHYRADDAPKAAWASPVRLSPGCVINSDGRRIPVR